MDAGILRAGHFQLQRAGESLVWRWWVGLFAGRDELEAAQRRSEAAPFKQRIWEFSLSTQPKMWHKNLLWDG